MKSFSSTGKTKNISNISTPHWDWGNKYYQFIINSLTDLLHLWCYYEKKNHMSFKSETLSKETMKRTKLCNKFLKDRD